MPTDGTAVTVRLEFTVEPFVEGGHGPHVRAAVDAVRAAGLEVEIGPFGSAVVGEVDAITNAVTAMIAAAMEAGATRVSMQVEQTR